MSCSVSSCLPPLSYGGLPDTIERTLPSIVGIGTVQKTRRPPAKLVGTGFVVGDGRHVITNAHVLPKEINTAKLEYLAVFTGKGNKPQAHQAVKVKVDETHDLVLLRFEGKPLPALSLGQSSRVREGEEYAFTGFPLGAIFGLHPVTHHGIISAITPIALQANAASQLDPAQIRRLRSPYNVFQLDATAFPFPDTPSQMCPSSSLPVAPQILFSPWNHGRDISVKVGLSAGSIGW